MVETRGGPVAMNAPLEAAIAPLVLSRMEGSVCHLTLNRGARYNALSREMIAALTAELTRIASDRSIRCIVLGAEGKGFCAGHDLKELRAHPDLAWQQTLFAECNALMLLLTTLPQPVVARVHGIATAAGCQLVSMCDLAVAAETARFALPGVNVGVFCTTPAVGVGRNIGRKRVMEMLLTGKPIDAATALQWGLVNRAVAADRLDEAVQEFVDAILAKSSAVICGGKRAFYDQLDRPLADAYDAAGKAMTQGV